MPFNKKSSLSFSWLWQPFQFKPGKPAYIQGAKTLLILSGPLAAGFFLGQLSLSAIPTISALFVGIVNVNGTYRQQIRGTGSAAIGIALALLLANLVSGSIGLAIATTFIVIFLLSLASVFGTVAASVGLVTSIMFVVSLARFASFPDLATLLEQCALSLAGGLWAMAVSSSVWIVRPYTPVGQAVADCYLTLSQLAQLAAVRVSGSQDRQNWIEQFLRVQDTATQNLTTARSLWTSVWDAEKVDSPEGSRLLISIEDANQMTHTLVALVELTAVASQSAFFKHLQPQIEQAIQQVSASLHRLSGALKRQQKPVPLQDLEHSVEALEHQWQSLRHHIHQGTFELRANEYVELVSLRKIVTGLSELSAQVRTDAEIATNPGRSLTRPAGTFLPPPAQSSWLAPIQNNLTFRSVAFRHALRLAIVVVIAQLLAYWLPIPQGYWVTLTALIALKPNFGGTFQITSQRVFGTCIGGVIGIGLVMLIHNAVVITLLILLLMFAAMSLRPLSYSFFLTLLTPVIILLLNAMGSGSWEVGIFRIADSLIGGALALLGSYWLFPSWERQQLPAQLEQTIRANLAYFQAAIARYLDGENEDSGPTFERAIHRLRHQAALENANAEASAQRLFSEPRHIRGEIEPVMTLMLYIRSLFSAVTALTEHLKAFGRADKFVEIEPLTEAIPQVLANLADGLNRGQPLQPLPPLAEDLAVICGRIEQLHSDRLSEVTAHTTDTTPTLQAVQQQTPVVTSLSRIVRAVTVMHSAVGRLR